MENNNGGKVPVSSQNQDIDSGTKYTIPGILHFIQHEWARFEMDRAHWDVEKAELQVYIAWFLSLYSGCNVMVIFKSTYSNYSISHLFSHFHFLKTESFGLLL